MRKVIHIFPTVGKPLFGEKGMANSPYVNKSTPYTIQGFCFFPHLQERCSKAFELQEGEISSMFSAHSLDYCLKEQQ